jgi:hypothetical protein
VVGEGRFRKLEGHSGAGGVNLSAKGYENGCTGGRKMAKISARILLQNIEIVIVTLKKYSNLIFHIFLSV